jgi:hypothetical protein
MNLSTPRKLGDNRLSRSEHQGDTAGKAEKSRSWRNVTRASRAFNSHVSSLIGFDRRIQMSGQI